MARATANGFTVTKPWGDSARYDFAVERNGIFQRVQVKSTAARSGPSYICNTIGGPSNKNRKYDSKHVDFFAIILVPEEVWYIIPVGALGRERSCFNLNPQNPTHRYFKYLEAWHLLKQAVGVDINAEADASSVYQAPSSESAPLVSGF